MTKYRKIMVVVWCFMWLLILYCLLIPDRFTYLKLGLILGLCVNFRLTQLLFGSKVVVRRASALVGVIILIFVIFLMLPGRNYSISSLRYRYIKCLLTYKGTHYHWGGGNSFGIDCSGLVERGMINAEFIQGISTFNPGLMRSAISLWWFNRSASALGACYRGDTSQIMTSSSINSVDYNYIHPGDLAVLADGVHVMAYLGKQKWIEADPKYMCVVIVYAPRPQDVYFTSPVHIMRWSILTKHND